MDWRFEFMDASRWQQHNHEKRQIIAKFLPDGTYLNPAMNADGYRWHLTLEGGVQVETSPPHRVQRTSDGGWVCDSFFLSFQRSRPLTAEFFFWADLEQWLLSLSVDVQRNPLRAVACVTI